MQKCFLLAHKFLFQAAFGVLVLTFILAIFGCKDGSLFKDDELSLQKQDYIGNELLLSGIYYSEYYESHYQIYALYRNGVIRDLGVSTDINNPKFLSGNSKPDWGVFQINNNEIKFERWYPSSGGGARAYVRAGTILNDSTFKITESYRNQKGEKTEISEENEIYHFRAFSPKPDSTNSYIK